VRNITADKWEVGKKLPPPFAARSRPLSACPANPAEDGQILIDAAAAAEIGDAGALMSLGTRALRGFSEPVPVFSVRPQAGDAVPADPAVVAKPALGG
jgi:hypothetical protein